MTVLILKNVHNEGPETIEDYLVDATIPFTEIDLQRGQAIPDTEKYDTLIIMGGPMSVNDDLAYIRQEEEIVREFISQDKKILGICLGAQIMAKALGAKVYSGKEKEIGWYDIELTEEGLNDPLMQTLKVESNRNFAKVFQWHGETFDIPDGAVRLACSDLYLNQAFKYGENAYAFQFHVEVRKNTIFEWLKNEKNVDLNLIKDQTNEIYDNYVVRAYKFFDEFFSK